MDKDKDSDDDSIYTVIDPMIHEKEKLNTAEHNQLMMYLRDRELIDETKEITRPAYKTPANTPDFNKPKETNITRPKRTAKKMVYAGITETYQDNKTKDYTSNVYYPKESSSLKPLEPVEK
ncbi:MAG: hypothetical protein NTW49_02905 [Bacteroidia bacterium]|nr:hypothetical protein [Bacteroidia bacterium]